MIRANHNAISVETNPFSNLPLLGSCCYCSLPLVERSKTPIAREQFLMIFQKAQQIVEQRSSTEASGLPEWQVTDTVV